MGNADYEYPSMMNNGEHRGIGIHKVEIPPPQPFIKSLKNTVKETLFPDDPLRQFKNQTPYRKFVLGIQYFFPIFEWGSRYNLGFFKSDLIAGITIASLAIPQGISYAKLGNLPPILGLYQTHSLWPVTSHLPEPKYVIAMGACTITGGMFSTDSYSTVRGVDKVIPVDVYLPGCPPKPEAVIDAITKLHSSFIPPLVYALMGSSRDLAVGTVAVGSLLMASMLGNEVNAAENPTLYLHLAFTATFFTGLFQIALGFFRLGFIVDFLSHATIVGFMGGAATVVILQQLKSVLGLQHFTHATDVVSVLRSVFSQTHQWRWESAVLGFCFLFYLMLAKFLSQKRPKLFWVSAMAPLTSVILGTILVYITHAEKHGVAVIGELKKGINPPSIMDLSFGSKYVTVAIKTGIVTGVIALAEGIAVGRSFAMCKNYHIDGNKEMIAFGMMNIVGSCTSCYLTTGPFSRSAVNFNAGCKTAVSNIVMALAVMVTLLLLTPLFHFTPLVVLSSIIIAAMLGLIDYNAAIHLWHVDKFDFLVCMSAYIGVVFGNIEIGLVMAIGLSLLRVLLYIARPRTLVLGNIPDSMIYRNVEQYPNTNNVPGVLILDIGAPIYFTNSSYLRERISRWIDDEEEKIKSSGETTLQYVILDMGAVGNIDTSGISMFEEVKKNLDRRDLKLVLANPGAEVMKKLNKSKFIEKLGHEWMFLTVGEAVEACSFMLHSCKLKSTEDGAPQKWSNNV